MCGCDIYKISSVLDGVCSDDECDSDAIDSVGGLCNAVGRLGDIATIGVSPLGTRLAAARRALAGLTSSPSSCRRRCYVSAYDSVPTDDLVGRS